MANTEKVEAIGLAIEHLNEARSRILTAKHVLRSAGAIENLTIHQVQGLVKDMDTYVLDLLHQWKKAEEGS